MFDWQKFLNGTTSANPNLNSTQRETLGKDNQEKHQLCPLSQYQLIIVEGPDAQKFLQGQCTCDFVKLTLDNFTLGAHCTPKGRMISSFLAAKTAENQFILRTHNSTVTTLLNSLKKYAVFSKVTLSISNTLACFGLLGEKQILTNLLTSNDLHSVTIKRTIEHKEAYELWLAPSTMPNSFLSTLPLVANQQWDLMLIRNGIGEVREQTTEALLPQEINLQLTNGIDFKKGCYTGQEIIARMHYRGQLKKHMYRGMISGLNDDTSTLNYRHLTDSQTGKNIGQILLCAQNNDNNTEFLAIINDEYVTNKMPTVAELPAAKIQWLRLPYAIT